MGKVEDAAYVEAWNRQQWEKGEQFSAAQDAELDEFVASLPDDVGESGVAAKQDLGPEVMASPKVGMPSDGEELLSKYYYPDFPDVQDQFGMLTNQKLVAALDGFLTTCFGAKATASYLDIRDDVCSINTIMNKRGATPPAFRPKLPLPKPVAGRKPTATETIMMLDRQIGDLEWLHARGKRDLLPSKEFASLFVGDEFDYFLAAEFAKKGWSAQSKSVKVLNLIEFEQLQMAVLRPRNIEDAWRNARVSMQQTIDKRLREQKVREPGLAPFIEEMKLLWLADKIAGRYGQKTVAQVFAWLTGSDPLAPSTLSNKLKRMRRRTSSKSNRS